MPRRLDPAGDQLVGPKLFARLFGRGYNWARDQLREWWEEEQVAGYAGPVRTIRKRGPGGNLVVYTTRRAIARFAPPHRDEAMLRKLAELEKDMNAMARRIADLEERMGGRRR